MLNDEYRRKEQLTLTLFSLMQYSVSYETLTMDHIKYYKMHMSLFVERRPVHLHH